MSDKVLSVGAISAAQGVKLTEGDMRNAKLLGLLRIVALISDDIKRGPADHAHDMFLGKHFDAMLHKSVEFFPDKGAMGVAVEAMARDLGFAMEVVNVQRGSGVPQ